MILDPKVVAQGWLDLRTGCLDEREKLLGAWADELLWGASYHDARYALEIVFAIHELDPTHTAVEVFASGPVEDILTNQGAVVIDEIEARARRDPSFAFVLGGVWQNAIPDPIWNRIVACRQQQGWDGITQ
ncbi:MAG: DUF6869 domain-containing protein [Luteolibacter sp.]|uniref:DUF6869 domain-containing protein n=1 Tax=Luteolibacter sp. TaxID=1962973 RepID=UPI003263EF66